MGGGSDVGSGGDGGVGSDSGGGGGRNGSFSSQEDPKEESCLWHLIK